MTGAHPHGWAPVTLGSEAWRPEIVDRQHLQPWAGTAEHEPFLNPWQGLLENGWTLQVKALWTTLCPNPARKSDWRLRLACRLCGGGGRGTRRHFFEGVLPCME